jgi:hypothetical protein
VYAGIGTAGGSNMNGGALDVADDLFESSLDGGKSGLNLPAVELGTVVGNFEA